MEEVEERSESADLYLKDDFKQLNDLASVMPDVVPEAVQAAADKDSAIEHEKAVTTDKKGKGFDSAIHAVDKDGRPILTPTGRFSKIRLPKEKGLNIPTQESLAPDLQYKAVAQTLVSLFIQSGFALVGDEWLPEKSKDMNEEANLVTVTESYCQSKGFSDLPAGVVVCVAFLAYGLRRVTRPRTKTMFQKFGELVKETVKKAFMLVTHRREQFGKRKIEEPKET